MATTSNIGRSLPHSIEAEEHLLSTCLLDGAETISRCIDQRITPHSFYEPKNGEIFGCILDLFHRQAPVDVSVVAEELKAAKKLDQVGGYAYLTQVSDRIPTTAQARYFIDKVGEMAKLRDTIKTLTRAVEDCYDYSGQMDEFLGSIRSRVEQLQNGGVNNTKPKGAGEFELLPDDDESMLLGRGRYIGRGDSALVVSSSGMGKSSFSVQWAVCAALGRSFLGIHTRKPIKSLIIQAEDSDGDIAEVLYSIYYKMKLTAADIEQVNKNVVFLRQREKSGEEFIAWLRMVGQQVAPDLVWLNPLHSYAGCDIADAAEIGRFLRKGLNVVNREEKFAFMVVHHTPKPVTGKNVPDKKWSEFMYDAAGSAELVNWARAVVTIKPSEDEGRFNIVLAKRGKRAGVAIEVPGNGDGVVRWEITTKIPAQHSNEVIRIEGRKSNFPVIFWEGRKPDAEEPVREGNKAKKNTGSYGEAYTADVLIVYYPEQATEGEPCAMIWRAAAEGCGVSKPTMARWQKRMIDDGIVEQLEDKRWRRTALGDELAKTKLRETA
jgi:hypothetical protein